MTANKGWDWDKALVSMPGRWTDTMEDIIPFITRLKREGKTDVYDLGCGVGRHSVYLAQDGFDVTASDVSESGVEKTRQWLAREGLQADVRQLDMQRMPFPIGSFDAVIAVNVVYHAVRAEIEQILSEVERVLRPGGMLFITFKSTRHSDHGQGKELAPHTFAPTSGIEEGVSHYYVDEDEVYRLLRPFDLVKIVHKQERRLENGDDELLAYWIAWAKTAA